jgi:hypothetical protein
MNPGWDTNNDAEMWGSVLKFHKTVKNARGERARSLKVVAKVDK